MKALQGDFWNPKHFINKASLRAYWAEFTGMFFFLFISVGTACSAYKTVSEFTVNLAKVTQTTQNLTDLKDQAQEAGFSASPDNAMVLLIAFAFGTTIMVLVYSVGHISGGHFNPAVTFATLLWGQINLFKGVLYVIVQMCGATAGAMAVKGLWPEQYGKGLNYAVNGIDPGLSLVQAIFLEIFGTACLTFVVYGTAVDPKGAPIVSHMAPVAIGFTVFLAHLLLVPGTGCGINPARSFGSNVASGVWKDSWVYWVGPLLGGPLGAGLHYFPLQHGDAENEEAKAVNIAGEEQDQPTAPQEGGADAAADDQV